MSRAVLKLRIPVLLSSHPVPVIPPGTRMIGKEKDEKLEYHQKWKKTELAGPSA